MNVVFALFLSATLPRSRRRFLFVATGNMQKTRYKYEMCFNILFVMPFILFLLLEIISGKTIWLFLFLWKETQAKAF